QATGGEVGVPLGQERGGVPLGQERVGGPLGQGRGVVPPGQKRGGDAVTTLRTTETGEVVADTAYGALRGASGELLPAEPLPARLAAGATARREAIRNSARRTLARRRA